MDASADVVRGGQERKVDFVAALKQHLSQRDYSPALVHLDLDVLDKSVGKVNGYESEGGLSEEELVACLSLVPKHTKAESLTVCSFDPNPGDGDKIARIAIRAIVAFAEAMLEGGRYSP